MMTESAEGLKRLLSEAGIEAESRAAARMQVYLNLLEKWNSAINLTATTSWSGLYPLFQEAIRASKFYPAGAAAHLDIGSGGGFPAIPLRILKPRMRLEMVESRSKRCVFLEAVSDALQIGETSVHNMRLDAFLERSSRDKVWDCISWKAVKLGKKDWRLLREHAHAQTQLWMFHGKDLAVEEPEEFQSCFKRMREEKLGPDREWKVSIYCLQ